MRKGTPSLHTKLKPNQVYNTNLLDRGAIYAVQAGGAMHGARVRWCSACAALPARSTAPAREGRLVPSAAIPGSSRAAMPDTKRPTLS
eukprot:683862-Pyramimonas_sp.AAC.1